MYFHDHFLFNLFFLFFVWAFFVPVIVLFVHLSVFLCLFVSDFKCQINTLTDFRCAQTTYTMGTDMLSIPYSFNSLQWRHTQTQSAHLITARVAPLRWRVYPRDQSRISAGVRKSLIYAPTSLQWVKWIGYSTRKSKRSSPAISRVLVFHRHVINVRS